MSAIFRNWQDVHTEVRRRIQSREWEQGSLIPNESDLAEEFGCARTTVNRALRSLADSGLLDRRRKAGTRVTSNPERKAIISIPVIRLGLEDQNKTHGYTLISSEMTKPPPNTKARMQLSTNDKLLHLVSLHMADSEPYLYEDRWINPDPVPQVLDIDFKVENANEWLVTNAPFSRGDISFSAAQASLPEAHALGISEGEALFIMERTTWDHEVAITSVRQAFAPGYRMQTRI